MPLAFLSGISNISEVPPNRELVPIAPVILFSVKVPVLSEQIVVAFPITSHALRWRTRLLSFSILVVAKARAKVTASGSPSGTATTIIVTVTIKIWRNY